MDVTTANGFREKEALLLSEALNANTTLTSLRISSQRIKHILNKEREINQENQWTRHRRLASV